MKLFPNPLSQDLLGQFPPTPKRTSINPNINSGPPLPESPATKLTLTSQPSQPRRISRPASRIFPVAFNIPRPTDREELLSTFSEEVKQLEHQGYAKHLFEISNHLSIERIPRTKLTAPQVKKYTYLLVNE